MNNWKIAFFTCFALLLLVLTISAYSIIDQGYALTYQKDGYTSTLKDLDHLIDIFNNTDLKKTQIEAVLRDKNKPLFEDFSFKEDSIVLNRINLKFEGDYLKKITKQW